MPFPLQRSLLRLAVPCEVVDLLHVEAAAPAAVEGHGDEDAVVDRRPRPAPLLQVVALLQDLLQPLAHGLDFHRLLFQGLLPQLGGAFGFPWDRDIEG